MAETDAPRSLTDLADGIRIAMVTSPAPRGLDARPLTVQRVDDDRVWFLVAGDAEWLPAASAGPVNLALTASDRWVSLSGTASVVTDPGAIAELGDPISDAWFHGDHPPVALRVDVEHGDWWAAAGAPRVAVGLMKAKLTGAEPDTGDRGAVDV
ncbi:MAG: pyridoxamine 5'-phosphate oxidase family protein [Acidimicrobiales bacterium]